MSNHFHILVEIPEAPEDRGRSWSDEKFLKHLSCLYYGEYFGEIAHRLRHFRGKGWDDRAEELRDRYFARMWDLSRFMHDLKLRFARWFNGEHGRDGTLWSERFKSVLVESGHAARVVAAYIDLNPVRAGMAVLPEDYRWCGYAEAVAGVRRAREGLRLLVFEEVAAHLGEALGAEEASSWRQVVAWYRRNLYLEGEEGERNEARDRAGIPAARVADVLAQGGRLSEAGMLRCRVRHFTDGLVIGSEGFVEGAFRLARGHFSAKRQSGARKIRRVDTLLRTMRDLRKDAVGV